MRTPWGKADEVITVGEVDGHAIKRVDTPSHGGYHVPSALLKYIPEAHQARALYWSGSRNWYEEDCEWASVCAAFPQFFPAEAHEHARETIAWREEREREQDGHARIAARA